MLRDRGEPTAMRPSVPGGLGGFLAAITGCEAVGGVGALVSLPGIKEWLPTLDQPRLQPPDSVFGPVWTVLYATIGVSWRLTHLESASTERRSAERWLAAELVLNALWSYIFFGRRRIGWALVDSAALLTAVGISVVKVRRVNPLASRLLVPYLAWVVFATGLNAALWRRNRPRGRLAVG